MHLDAMPLPLPWTSTWTLTSSRIDSFAHLGQHGDDPHQKSLAGFQNLLVGQVQNLACVEDCSALHRRAVDVDVNDFSHRLTHLGQHDRSPWLLKENRVTPRDGSTNAGDKARNSIQSGRHPGSRAQAYSRQSTTTSTITSTSTSASMASSCTGYFLTAPNYVTISR